MREAVGVLEMEVEGLEGRGEVTVAILWGLSCLTGHFMRPAGKGLGRKRNKRGVA